MTVGDLWLFTKLRLHKITSWRPPCTRPPPSNCSSRRRPPQSWPCHGQQKQTWTNKQNLKILKSLLGPPSCHDMTSGQTGIWSSSGLFEAAQLSLAGLEQSKIITSTFSGLQNHAVDRICHFSRLRQHIGEILVSIFQNFNKDQLGRVKRAI